MTIHDQFLRLLDEAISRFGSANKLAKYLNVPPNLITRWKNKQRIPQLDTIQPLMDMMKAELTAPVGVKLKNVCFVNARVIDADSVENRPKEEDYFAVPILGEVGAGTGFVPENEVKGWFMVHRSVTGSRDIRNLVAVEIAPHSISMRPTLNPLDIALVDKDDRDWLRNGNIMLVLDPMDGSSMIKRVSAREVKGDVQITFYSDNFAQYPPMVYSLMQDFGGEWHNAIVGKVIWAWTDMREK